MSVPEAMKWVCEQTLPIATQPFDRASSPFNKTLLFNISVGGKRPRRLPFFSYYKIATHSYQFHITTHTMNNLLNKEKLYAQKHL